MTFCRHNRLETSCPICSRKLKAKEQEAARGRRPARQPGRSSAPRRASSSSRRSASSDLRVRRLTRAQEDGFHSDLVPGLRSSADAERLAQELAFAAARLDELGGASPPGLYAQAQRLGGEEGLWLAFLIAYLGPLTGGEQPFAEIDRVRVPWDGGELPDLDEVRVGPRGAHEAARGTDTLIAYRAWAARAGSQAAGLAGQDGWTAERRFERAFERLALPGLLRGARYEFLLTSGALGLADLRPSSLHLLADPRDPTLTAAKRVFGIGDVLLVQRRAGELLAATGVPIGAFDLGLLNWARLTDAPQGGRIDAGSSVTPDPDVVELVRDALGIAPDDGHEPDDDEPLAA